MPDVELTRDYAGGAAKAGDCGKIDHENRDGTVNVLITRHNCSPVPPMLVDFVKKEHLKPCHCDEEDEEDEG